MAVNGLKESVSRETREALDHYLALLRKWNPRINLVSPATLAEAETRHIQDSLQLLEFAPESTRIWADLGSGGGFPGLVLAIAAKARFPELKFHLVESDQRKSVFLRTVSRETETPITVHSQRIEQLPGLEADVVSARALAPLPALLPLVQRHLKKDGLALLPKGTGYEKELLEARGEWAFHHEPQPSKTQSGAVILKIGALRHV